MVARTTTAPTRVPSVIVVDAVPWPSVVEVAGFAVAGIVEAQRRPAGIAGQSGDGFGVEELQAELRQQLQRQRVDLLDVGGGMAVYFPLVWLFGGVDKEALKTLIRRKKPVEDAG